VAHAPLVKQEIAVNASTPSDTADPVVAVHDTNSGAEAAVKALGRAGFDLKTVSIVGKGCHGEEHAHGFYAFGDRVRVWGATGGFWGAAWALLLGSAVFVMPPLGIVAAAGPFTLVLAATLESAMVVGGVSALCAALASLGTPHERAVKYESDVAANRFLVIVHGSPEDADRAREILASVKAGQALPFHQAA
jgi:hypothetical protein